MSLAISTVVAVFVLAAMQHVNCSDDEYQSIGEVLSSLDLNLEWFEASLYAGFFVNILAFAIEGWPLQYASGSTVALFACMDPPVTALMGYLALDEPLSWVRRAAAARGMRCLGVRLGVGAQCCAM